MKKKTNFVIEQRKRKHKNTNSVSLMHTFGEGPDPSPPRSDKRRTWLAVIPSVTCCDGSECFRVSRHGDKR